MSRRLGRAALVSALLLTSPAFADEAPKQREPTAGDLASARNALREGLTLRDKGDTNAALARLQSAWDFVPTPVTGFELGKTHLMLGHVLQAHELFAKVGRLPLSMEESARSQSARDESARLVKETAPRIPSLRITLTLPPNATAEVQLDDERLQMSGAETTRLVEVGAHEITAKAGDGPEQTVHVEVAEGEVKPVQLTPQWIAPKEKPALGPGGQVIYVRTTNPLTFIGFGIAAGALVLTTVATVIRIDAQNDQDDRCGTNYCPPVRTSAFGLGTANVFDREFDSATGRANAAILLMGIGGITTLVFGGIGAVFATRPIKERVTAHTEPTLKPSVRFGGAGLSGTF